MASTPPPHGERARYLRGCRCRDCLNAHYRYMSQYRLDRERGQKRRVDSTQAATRINELLATGWNQAQIATAAGTSRRSISYILSGTSPTISRNTERRILTIHPDQTPPPPGCVDPTGTIRRVRALAAIGYPIAHIADAAGMHRDALTKITRGNFPRVRATTADTIASVYRRLADTPGPSQRARNTAAKQGWAPPGAWDNIDNPAELPEWTGHCGTDRGWWLHSMQKLPTCHRCETAHQQWKQDHAHLDKDQRWAALGRARAEAASRGQSIADDARELLALGYPLDVIAQRLGITRGSIKQELHRYPNPSDYEEAS